MPQNRKSPESARQPSPVLGWIAAIAIIAAVGVFLFTRKGSELPPPASTQTATQAPAPDVTPSPVSPQKEPEYRVPAYFEDPAAAEPLAATLDPPTVQAHARAAYQVAQKKPRLLAQLPCFCYCDRFGHKSLHDCFVSNHAEECDVCMREALEADQMESRGMSPQKIRAAIIAGHHPKS